MCIRDRNGGVLSEHGAREIAADAAEAVDADADGHRAPPGCVCSGGLEWSTPAHALFYDSSCINSRNVGRCNGRSWERTQPPTWVSCAHPRFADERNQE